MASNETAGLKYQEKKADLFSCSEDTSLAHCVSEDLHMGKGIATIFKKKFGGVSELQQQGKKIGEVAILKKEQRYIFYLITKAKYFHKPTYDSLKNSLQAMRDHCLLKDVKKLAMPRIGCGLDRLEWYKVRDMIKEVFAEVNMELTVYVL